MKKVKIIPNTKETLFKININQSKLFIPDWYKNSSSKIKGLEKYSLVPSNPNVTTSTYKKCSPFLDSLINGYMFSLSQDIEVTEDNDGNPFILWRDSTLKPISWHDNEQWDGFKHSDNFYNFVYKWENNFTIKTPKKYSTLFTHPHNRFDLPFQTLSGVVDTDNFKHPVQFPFFIKKGFSGIIKAGTPVAQITFFKRERWIRSVGKYNENKINKEKFDFFSNIDRSYKKMFWEKKQYD